MKRFVMGGMLAGAALAVVLFTAAVASGQSGDAIPGGTYRGTLTDTSGLCDEGGLRIGSRIAVQLNPRGTRITAFVVDELYVANFGFLGLSTIPVDIPIDDTGAFATEFDPLNLGLARVRSEGRFEGEALSGSVRITDSASNLECAGTFSAEAVPVPSRGPQFLSGTIEAGARCGGGFIRIVVGEDELSILAIEVSELQLPSSITSGAATFAEGTVPIGDDGSFGWTYFPGSELGEEIAVIGSLSALGGPGALYVGASGAVTLSPSECGSMPFSAAVLPSDGPSRGGPAPENVLALPDAGTGSAGFESGWRTYYWLLAFGSFAYAVGLALALRTKRTTR